MASRTLASDLSGNSAGAGHLSIDWSVNPRPRSPFRADIQALRALAVAAVVVYHLWPNQLPGGFVGVDIFFVISGYLITAHLLGEVERTGRIALLDFWSRRIRRLLPAAFTVLIGSVVAMFTLMPSVTWQNTLREVAASAAYVENWLLAHDAVDYLASENSATLAQHYWSLSVEEQFYIIWPLLLMVALAISGRTKNLNGHKAITAAIGFILLSSFAFSLIVTVTQPAFAFFATPARAWEFAAGGLVATFSSSRGPTFMAGARRVAAWIGPLTILISVLFINGSMSFPGLVALVPVAGAVLCIFGGEHSNPKIQKRIVENPAVQWLGNYSYPIYLWHWPLIIITPWVLHGDPSWSTKLILLGMTLALAYLTKRFIEDPVRTGGFWRGSRWPAYSLAGGGMALLIAVSATGYLQVEHRNDIEDASALQRVVSGEACFGALAMTSDARCKKPYARPDNLDTAFAAADVYAPAAHCQTGREVTEPVRCTFGEQTSPTKVVAVVGNSHAVRLMPALDLYGMKNGWKILLMASTDCMGLTTQAVGKQSADDTCLTWSRNVQQTLLATPELDAVVFASHVSAQNYLAGASPSADDIRNASNQVISSWSAFVEQGVRVIVTEDVPGMRPTDGPECIALSAQTYDPCSMPRSEVVKSNLMTELAQEHSHLVSFLPLEQYFCDLARCHSLIGGVIVYSDSHHLTTTYSRTLATYIGSSIADTLRP